MAGAEKKSRVAGERALIQAIRARAPKASGPLRLGIGDDCAILRPARDEEIVITTDLSLENIHFRRNWHPPESVGHRCLARGLSDIAAMGARPIAAFLSMSVPEELLKSKQGKSWFDRFFHGFLALAREHKVPLAGGDTASSHSLAAFDIVLIGAVKQGHALLRSNAKAGDAIYVTGALGGAAAELQAMQRNPRRFARFTTASADHPHLYPQPRLAIAKQISRYANAAIDISDGLSTDLTHLCQESNLNAELEASAIPIHPLANTLDQALHGGEDYELLFTASPKMNIPNKIAGTPIHRIGTMHSRKSRQPRIRLRKEDGTVVPIKAGGWEHFHH